MTADEFRHEGACRPLAEILGGAHLYQASAVHQGDTVAELKGLDAGYNFERGERRPFRSRGARIPTLEEVSQVLSPRARTSERLNQEVAKAVVAMCDFLDSDQREELVSLLLTGAISL